MLYSEKIEVVETLAGKFARAPITILSDYRGLTVAEITEFRRKVTAAGGELVVAKNTLTKLAIKDKNQVVLEPMLAGPTALAFGYEDAAALAKAVDEFADKAEALELKGGVLDGDLLQPEQVKQLASMPSRDELRAQLLALMMTPATQLVRLLNTPATQLMTVLDARRGSLEE